ncbi:MAG: hypothetical protein AABZ15_11745 [Nitrospirota bacterium]
MITRTALFIFCMAIAACGTSHGPTPVRELTNAGEVVTRLEPTPTASRDNLPAGVKRQDVAVIITLTPEAETNKNTNAASPPKSGTHGGSGRITVTKDGKVYADDLAMSAIEAVETPEPSHAWRWWAGGILFTILSLAWASKQFAWVGALLSPIGGLIKRLRALLGGKP